MEKEKKQKSTFWQGWGWTFFIALIMELFEETIEETIAIGIVIIIDKAVSTLLVVGLAQTGKLLIKRLIKTITYKEGNDKVKFLKNYFTLAWGNKVTGTTAGILGGGLVWFQSLVPQVAGVWYYSLIAFIVIYNFSIIFGGENLSQILDRFAQKTLKKEEYSKIKAAEQKAKEIAKRVDEEFKRLQAENDLRLKEQAKAKILAETEKVEVNNESIENNS